LQICHLIARFAEQNFLLLCANVLKKRQFKDDISSLRSKLHPLYSNIVSPPHTIFNRSHAKFLDNISPIF